MAFLKEGFLVFNFTHAIFKHGSAFLFTFSYKPNFKFFDRLFKILENDKIFNGAF